MVSNAPHTKAAHQGARRIQVQRELRDGVVKFRFRSHPVVPPLVFFVDGDDLKRGAVG